MSVIHREFTVLESIAYKANYSLLSKCCFKKKTLMVYEDRHHVVTMTTCQLTTRLEYMEKITSHEAKKFFAIVIITHTFH